MATLAVNLDDVYEPSAEDIAAARDAARKLMRLNPANKAVRFVPDVTGEGAEAPEPISLPANIFREIVKMLKEMGNGNAITIVPVTSELTTQQAADLLNVSRPHLVKLIDQKILNCRMVGTHRKLAAKEVLAYQAKIYGERRDALSSMIEMDEELGLYDDEPISGED
jgi:excisionase family DNA binding protein